MGNTLFVLRSCLSGEVHNFIISRPSNSGAIIIMCTKCTMTKEEARI